MGQPLTGIRVLVIEDDADNRDILEQTLRFQGATVTPFSTARAALPALADADIVVTDYALPDADGVWVLEQINLSPHPVPVIVVSGFAESQRAALAAAPFARKFLKPVDAWQLAREILAVLGRPAPP